ncbi:MAG: hypothetical protein H6R04_2088 [Burkholderiaceae bacterium]|nr:hypothetical protein [Burkholderiaceae bacterium]
MTRYVGAVIFADQSKLYLIYDGMMDVALRPLFLTEKAALEWANAGMPASNGPRDVDSSDEAVTVIPDVAETANGSGIGSHFASRASKKSMWLTGPCSFMEMVYQNGATACREF